MDRDRESRPSGAFSIASCMHLPQILFLLLALFLAPLPEELHHQVVSLASFGEAPAKHLRVKTTYKTKIKQKLIEPKPF